MLGFDQTVYRSNLQAKVSVARTRREERFRHVALSVLTGLFGLFLILSAQGREILAQLGWLASSDSIPLWTYLAFGLVWWGISWGVWAAIRTFFKMMKS